MTTSGFYSRLQEAWDSGRFLCVGLDPDDTRIPQTLPGSPAERAETFCCAVSDATAEFAAAFKLNSAYFEALGADGARALEAIVTHLRTTHPSCLVILDAKRGDIDHTNTHYAHAGFDILGADVVTVHPYIGGASLRPFTDRTDRGVIVMGANSSPGAGEFQDLPVGPEGTPLYEYVCATVAERWNTHQNCAVTAGATEPDKLARIRAVVGEMPILLLGLGAQAGNLDESLRVGTAPQSFGLIPNSSRDILYRSTGTDFARAARSAAQETNSRLAKWRPTAG